jgi:hypothetical protein
MSSEIEAPVKGMSGRKSDIGVHNGIENASSKVDMKRRQTIADIAMKENDSSTGSILTQASESKAVNIEPTKRPSTTSSPFKHHHTPVALGSAASYYFKGAPQTPVQKLVRSEQQKLLLQVSMHVDDQDNTGIVLMNQSYLSSSSSSGGRSSSRDNDTEILNTSVLSDTTELTASNFLTLAATHRTTAEDIRKLIEEQRQPLSAILPNSEEVVTTVSHAAGKSKRRQSMSEGIAIQRPVYENGIAPRRRETMTSIPNPRSASSLVELPAMAAKKQQSQPRERNKVADHQRRLSDSSHGMLPKAMARRRSSIAINPTVDATEQLSIPASEMKNILNL